MATIRIATFNVENLLQRFDFYRYGRLTVEPSIRLLGVEDFEERLRLRKAFFVGLTDDTRQLTAQTIRDTGADVICLQEVDHRAILDDFHNYYLDRTHAAHYGWRRLIDGNDNRGIDVAVMSKQRITVQSHSEVTFDDFGLFNQALRDYGLGEGDRIFRRDCLEVNLTVQEKPLSIFVCHFKSMSGGRARTLPVRKAEAQAVRRIIEQKFGGSVANSDWIVAGDLNDYTHENGQPAAEHGLGALLDGGFSVNLVDRLPQADRWTHYYAGDQSFHQLDYILASPALANKNRNATPAIIRKGQPYRVPGTEGIQRYPRVGFERPKASDHCPVAVTLEI